MSDSGAYDKGEMTVEPVTGYHRCANCGRLFYLYANHQVVAPITCRRVMGNGPLGDCLHG